MQRRGGGPATSTSGGDAGEDEVERSDSKVSKGDNRPLWHKKRFWTVVFLVTLGVYALFGPSSPLHEDPHAGAKDTSPHQAARESLAYRLESYVGLVPQTPEPTPAPTPKPAPTDRPEPQVILDPSTKWGTDRKPHIDDTVQYNVYLSDRMPLDRAVPDLRPKGCKARIDKFAWDKFAKVSIIIIAFNEATSALLRTVTSIENRSPSDLLLEVIIIDDASDLNLDEHFSHMPKVRTFRNKFRLGVARSRNYGVSLAKGEVVVFLDAHVEVGRGWLGPLLDRIHRDGKTVVAPIIDHIQEDTLEYMASPWARRGEFDWSLNFRWKNMVDTMDTLPPEHLPFENPVLSGGMVAMEKELFERLGEYDEGMETYGVEYIEMSLRTWMCHGRIEIDPCSRVGHIYRTNSPMGRKDFNHMDHNKHRTAVVWMDSYAYLIIAMMRVHKQDWGDVKDRKALRKKLKCRSFDWFLKNVMPDHTPPLHRTTLRVGAADCMRVKPECDPDTRWKWTKYGYFEGMCMGVGACHATSGDEDPADPNETHLKFCRHPYPSQDRDCQATVELFSPNARETKITLRLPNGDIRCMGPWGSTQRFMLLDCGDPDTTYTSTADRHEIRQAKSDRCLWAEGTSIAHRDCSEATTDTRGKWTWDCHEKALKPPKNMMRELTGEGKMCIDAMGLREGPVGMTECHGNGLDQNFAFDSLEDDTYEQDGKDYGILRNANQSLCLMAPPKAIPGSPAEEDRDDSRPVVVTHCGPGVTDGDCRDNIPGAEINPECLWYKRGQELVSEATGECLRARDGWADTATCDPDAKRSFMSWDSGNGVHALCRDI
mmetsp:Transcript_44763/g.83563  ORF Transcript_44763/g.83563 Transcript_44763/m.83563 type:complete len:824 (-) Transcript_44763:99-2570(-)